MSELSFKERMAMFNKKPGNPAPSPDKNGLKVNSLAKRWSDEIRKVNKTKVFFLPVCLNLL